jgi:hypothetical protein
LKDARGVGAVRRLKKEKKKERKNKEMMHQQRRYGGLAEDVMDKEKCECQAKPGLRERTDRSDGVENFLVDWQGSTEELLTTTQPWSAHSGHTQDTQTSARITQGAPGMGRLSCTGGELLCQQIVADKQLGYKQRGYKVVDFGRSPSILLKRNWYFATLPLCREAAGFQKK